MRIKRSTHRKDRRKKILKLAEGYWGGKSRLHRIAIAARNSIGLGHPHSPGHRGVPHAAAFRPVGP